MREELFVCVRVLFWGCVKRRRKGVYGGTKEGNVIF